MGVTIVDIAKEAGVTPGTVSIALSGRGRVGAQTRHKIRELARRLGYSPNASAQILKKKIPFDIRYLVGDNNADASCIPHFLRFCDAYSLQYQIEFVDLRRFDKPVDGLFENCKGVLHVGYIAPAVKRFVERHPAFPFVSVNEASEHCVLSDLRTGTKNSVEYLLARGYRRIAFALCDFDYDAHAQIGAAVADAVECFGLDTPREWIHRYHGPETGQVTSNERLDDILENARVWASGLFDAPRRPDAFFCSGINQARAVVYEAAKRGLRIPEDVAVIGHGTEESAIQAYPRVTNLSQNYVRNVQEGLILLQSLITRQRVPEKRILTEPQLTPRHTTEAQFKV